MSKSYYWYDGSGRICLHFPSLEDAQYCAHQGECLPEVQETMGLDWMASQLAKVDPEDLRRDLAEHGAWDDEELADHDANLERLVWIAANDVAEDPGTYEEEGQ